MWHEPGNFFSLAVAVEALGERLQEPTYGFTERQHNGNRANRPLGLPVLQQNTQTLMKFNETVTHDLLQ